MKGVISSQSGEICSVTFDTEGSNAVDGVSCKLSVSPEVIGDSTEHQKEPNQSQLDTKPPRSHPDADPAETGCNEEKEKGAEEGIFQGSQEIPDDSQVLIVKEKEEHEALNKSSSELGDPSGRRRSDIKSPEPSSAANGEQTCGPVPEADVDKEETEHTEADVGAETKCTKEAKPKDKDSKEDHADRPRLAEEDSRFTVSKHPVSLVYRKKEHIWKQECRSFRHLEVLQIAAVAFL